MNINQVRHLLKIWRTKEFQGNEEFSDEEVALKLTQFSQTKRFFQKWDADPAFKQEISRNPHQADYLYKLDIKPDEIELLRNQEQNQQQGQGVAITLLSKNYREFTNAQLNWCEHIRHLANSPVDSRFMAWRERQIARCLSQFVNRKIEHFPMCFELSKGCSVGCWFCGVSAPKISDIFFHNEENAKLWRDVLSLMKQMLGSAAGSGFCYCATDPFDNPDYEKFLCDFQDILGVFPQTTTAQPLKNPVRTRSFLKLSLEKGCLLNRFSILSLKILNQLHEEFSPEELSFVELVLQNEESGIPKSNSGRARVRNKRKSEKNHEVLDDSFSGTSACVSGFLFNMVDRSVKLISPCNSSDLWPLGYIVYDEGIFTNADDLKILLEKMIDKHMPLTVSLSERIRFRSDLKYESTPDGFQLSTRFLTLKFQNDPYLKQLGEIIHKGDKTAEEIARFLTVCGVSSIYTFQSLNVMFKNGVLANEPQAKTLQSKLTHEQPAINSQPKIAANI